MKTIIFYLILLFSTSLIAGNEFLLLDANPRQASLGSSGAGSGDVRDFNLNPAVLSTATIAEVRSGFMSGLGGLNLANLFASIPLQKSSFAISFQSLFAAPETETVGGISTGESLNYSDSWIGMHFGWELKKSIGLGASAKYIFKNLAGYKATSLGFDVGVQYSMNVFSFSGKKKNANNLFLGFSALNLGLPTKFISESENLPLSFRAGASYKPFQMLTLIYDLDWSNETKTFQNHAGTEFNFNDIIFIRGGLSTSPNEISIKTGIGIRSWMSIARISFDYSIAPLDQARLGHFLSFRIEL